MIPRRLHIIWVGDESRRPDNCIATWVRHHPDWEVTLWDNAAYGQDGWINKRHMEAMWPRELNGVADLMRWEILLHHGGVLVDADSVCLRPLEDWMLECAAWACWESELARPGLIAAGYVGAAPGNPLMRRIVEDLRAAPTVVDRPAWQSVGPQRLTDAWRAMGYADLTIFPSHFFIPEHFTGVSYGGGGPVYARQEWASTRKSYDRLHRRRLG